MSEVGTSKDRHCVASRLVRLGAVCGAGLLEERWSDRLCLW